jgi:glycerol uptake facilitator-like aquaporin
MAEATMARRHVGEALGTALLLATVVGSGIMAERLSGGNDGLALLANTLATGAVLPVLILIFAPVSGAHLNPAVTAMFALRRELSPATAAAYVMVQAVGAVVGVALAHAMFGLPPLDIGAKARSGLGQWIAEAVATGGLVLTILGVRRAMPAAVPFAVGLWITAAYWFTASTSFANPAVTLARSASDTFAGIRPADVPGFVVAQLLGAAAATLLFRWLVPSLPEDAEEVVVPHGEEGARRREGAFSD